VGFYICPEEDQEGVAEADKLWRLGTGPEDENGRSHSFFWLSFAPTTTQAEMISLIRGLLQS
jgi:hypothetical protein